jgi:hypothetical protein
MFQINAKLRLITNFVLFQICWFSALFFQNGALFTICICLSIMVALVRSRLTSLCLLAVLLPVSILFEFIAISLGLVVYDSLFMPMWLVGLWVGLLLTFNDSFRFMLNLQYWKVVIAFTFFGPLSYSAGAKAGALVISESTIYFFVVFGAMWAIYALFAKYFYHIAVIKCSQP